MAKTTQDLRDEQDAEVKKAPAVAPVKQASLADCLKQLHAAKRAEAGVKETPAVKPKPVVA